jgi:hypothetical protein
MGLLDWIKSGNYDEHDPGLTRREKGGLWSENHSSRTKADRQRVIVARAKKADKTEQAKLAKESKALQAKEQRKAAEKKAAGEKAEKARRAAYVKKNGSKKGGWW